MSKQGDRRPYMRPVTRIALSEKNIRLRWILIVVLLSVGVVAIAVGMMSALETEPGWQEVQVSSEKVNCSQDFVFQYDFGSSGGSAAAEYKQVTQLYTQLTEQAYVLFNPEAEPDQGGNLAWLNAHVNETVTVDHAVYQTLELLDRYNSRYPFLAPVYPEYNRVFLSASDAEAALYDPAKNPELAAYMQQIAAFASDETMIDVVLLGENAVQLKVSQAYLDFAAEYGIEVLVDLGWMKNAFIADYLADSLAQNGYTNGYLASYDGFTRNLDSRGLAYSYNIFDRMENTISIPASLSYSQPVAIAAMRNYPLSEEDRWHYYAYENGEIASIYLDVQDGRVKSATDNLVAYSYDHGCAQILLQTAPVFLTEVLQERALRDLEAEGIHSIWAEGSVIRYTQPGAKLELLPESGGQDYRLEKEK